MNNKVIMGSVKHPYRDSILRRKLSNVCVDEAGHRIAEARLDGSVALVENFNDPDGGIGLWYFVKWL